MAKKRGLEAEIGPEGERILDNQYEKNVSFVIFLLALFLFFKLVEPVLTIFLTSILITYTFYPLYKKVVIRVSNQALSIILTMLVIVIVLMIPFSYLVFEVTQQSFEFYNSLSGNIAKGALFGFGCTSADSKICAVLNNIEKVSAESLSKIGVDKQMPMLLLRFEATLTDYLIAIPLAILNGGFVLFISYYLFRDWEQILEKTVDLLPIRKKTIQTLGVRFEKITYAVVFAQLFVAFAQGFAAMIGFSLFGVPLPIFLGVLMAFFALIPAIGAAIIWVPVSFYLILMGYLTQDYITITKGIGICLYGVFVISTIDDLLRVKIIQAKADVHPLFVIIGVMGGVTLFGVIGLFLGPILLPLLMTYFETFKERFNISKAAMPNNP